MSKASGDTNDDRCECGALISECGDYTCMVCGSFVDCVTGKCAECCSACDGRGDCGGCSSCGKSCCYDECLAI
jgi:hypothetical protein